MCKPHTRRGAGRAVKDPRTQSQFSADSDTRADPSTGTPPPRLNQSIRHSDGLTPCRLWTVKISSLPADLRAAMSTPNAHPSPRWCQNRC